MADGDEFAAGELLRRLGTIESVVSATRETVIETKTSVTGLHEKVDRNDIQQRQLVQTTRELMETKIGEVSSTVADAHKRIDAVEERARANFRMIVTALVLPIVVLVIGSIFVYILIGNTPT